MTIKNDCKKITIDDEEFPVLEAALYSMSGYRWMVIAIHSDWIDEYFFDYCTHQKTMSEDLRIELLKEDGANIDGDSVFRHCAYDAHIKASAFAGQDVYYITIDYKLTGTEANDVSLISL